MVDLIDLVDMVLQILTIVVVFLHGVLGGAFFKLPLVCIRCLVYLFDQRVRHYRIYLDRLRQSHIVKGFLRLILQLGTWLVRKRRSLVDQRAVDGLIRSILKRGLLPSINSKDLWGVFTYCSFSITPWRQDNIFVHRLRVIEWAIKLICIGGYNFYVLPCIPQHDLSWLVRSDSLHDALDPKRAIFLFLTFFKRLMVGRWLQRN